jgi:hypothetical protein
MSSRKLSTSYCFVEKILVASLFWASIVGTKGVLPRKNLIKLEAKYAEPLAFKCNRLPFKHELSRFRLSINLNSFFVQNT